MGKNTNIKEIPSVIREILKKRGVEGNENIQRFLFPKLKDLPGPFDMKGMEKATEIILSFLTMKKQIIIWGDYDVDGTTGTALLVNFFKQLGTVVDWHIPNRLEEGYGLNAAWFNNQSHLSDSGGFLVITVDCGISDVDVIDHIMQMGGTVIVTDHHKIPEKSLPDCVILNPSQKECGFKNYYLAGVGVAFYLASGLRAKLTSIKGFLNESNKINLKQFLAFVALGTVADVVQLSSTNRILVRAGIEAIQYSRFPGIIALLNVCKMQNEKVGSEDIGFLLGPLINAAGRIGDSKTVVQLLTSETATESVVLANKLVRLNSKRKSVCAADFEVAKRLISETQVREDRCIIVAGAIHQGIAGIVASRLVDMFRVPTLVFCRKKSPRGEGMLVGSARSIDGISVIEALNNSSVLLVKYGGHDMAAGATLLEKDFSEFSVAFKSAIGGLMSAKPVSAVVENVFDCSVENIMGEEHLAFFELLEPFGPGNQLPVFIDKNTKIVDAKCVGRGSEHLQLAIRGKYANYKGIGFGLGGRKTEVQQSPDRYLRYTLTKNRFRGRSSWQVRVIDI